MWQPLRLPESRAFGCSCRERELLQPALALLAYTLLSGSCISLSTASAQSLTATMPVATAFISPPLGHSIPYHTPHAVSVSLPTWRDNVGYEEGEKRVVESMQTGYPRFFVHRSIQKVRPAASLVPR